jgi:hypothetical protein
MTIPKEIKIMYRYCLSFIAFAAVGGSPLLAQSAPDVQTITHRQVIRECEGGSCPATVCVPECYTKVNKTTVYASGCEPLCVGCPSLGKLFGRDCEGGNCEAPRTRKYLMKKVVTCEESATKCVPSIAGGCVTGIHGHAVAAPMIIPSGRGPVTTTGVVIMPAVTSEPLPSIVQKMPQASVTPR